MEGVIRKLRFKGQNRIAIINASVEHLDRLGTGLGDIQIDRCIDPRFPYEFMIIFAGNCADVKNLAPLAIHNLSADGVLWFVYPKKSAREIQSDIDRDHGWEPLEEMGFRKVSQVSVDDLWSALRFRNNAYVRSARMKAV